MKKILLLILVVLIYNTVSFSCIAPSGSGRVGKGAACRKKDGTVGGCICSAANYCYCG